MPSAEYSFKKNGEFFLWRDYHLCILPVNNCCMNGISFPVIHPAFEKLKNSGRLLHVLAALVLIAHALGHLGDSFNPVYFWCQLIFAFDILLLVFMGRNLVTTLPGINAFFRFLEFLFFMGISLLLILESKWIPAGFHGMLSIFYVYLFLCERRLASPESISLHHTGVMIPGLMENKFLLWTQINQLQATYHSIQIETSDQKFIKFNFRQNLSFDELDQIHEFCKHYLGEVDR
jgi:hypothetical protein